MSTVLDIPRGIIADDFTMNPLSMELVRGRNLKNGMIVLIENPHYRVQTIYSDDVEHNNTDEYDLRTFSRWCQVTEIFRDTQEVSFIGVYDDGTQAGRFSDNNTFWLVLIDDDLTASLQRNSHE